MSIVKTKSSYQQGDLDMLCGVYSLLNIVQLLNPISKKESQKLFFKMLRHLEKTKHQNLSKTIVNGLTFKDMEQLFKVFLTTENLCWEVPFHIRDKPDLNQYWNVLLNLLKVNKESCVFIRLRGTHNHWTIVKAMTKNSLILFDSDGLSRINRRNCCIQSNESKSHLLWPSNTVFICKNN